MKNKFFFAEGAPEHFDLQSLEANNRIKINLDPPKAVKIYFLRSISIAHTEYGVNSQNEQVDLMVNQSGIESSRQT